MAKLRTRSAGVGSDVIDIPDEPEAIAGDDVSAIATDTVSRRAYELWLERGCPEGSPEQDWYQAESEVKGRAEHRAAKPFEP